jgi:endogenous inhibitor of DNA gyrase (YacG/DUF329 family)
MMSCPICHKPAEAASTPFCSSRCRAVDLNRWFTGSYAVPAVELDDADAQTLAEALDKEPDGPDRPGD